MNIPTRSCATRRLRGLAPAGCTGPRRPARLVPSLHAATRAPIGVEQEPLGSEVAEGAVQLVGAAAVASAGDAGTSTTSATLVVAQEVAADATPAPLPAAEPVAAGGSSAAPHQPATTTGLLQDLTQLFDSKKKVQGRPFLPSFDGFAEMVLGQNPQDYTSETIKNFVGPHDGPIRLITPTVPRPPGSPDPATLPLIFYLPGIDGTGLAAYRQFPTLAQAFDLRCLVYPPGDRTPFDDLSNVIAGLVAAEVEAVGAGRPVYLMGESFGGLLCLAVAASTAGRAVVDRVVVVNPATSFARTPWPLMGGALTAMPPQLYSALPFALSPILTSPFSIAMHYVEDGAPLPNQISDFAYGLVGLVPELGNLRQVLPPATLAWRLQLLQTGCQSMETKYKQVQQRTLVIAGENDRLIPSSTEAPALARRLPRARYMILQGRSHALLQEAGVDLVSIIQAEGFYVKQIVLSVDSPPRNPPSASTSNPTSNGNGTPSNGVASPNGRATSSSSATTSSSAADSSAATTTSASSSTQTTTATTTSSTRRAAGSGAAFGTPRPVPLPTLTELDKAVEDGGISTLRRLVSPVYFSTDSSGRIMQGLDAVPVDKPLLFVGNHQLFAPDMPLMIEQFIRDKQMLLRGLAHPGVLQGMMMDPEGDASTGPGSRSSGDFLKTFGAVPVNGRNLFQLLQQGEAALLYPGGVREALKNKGEKYQLIWPERAEFVRMAARFGATIVPFGAVGAEDSVNLLMDQKEVLGLPVVGDWLRQQQAGFRQARGGVTASENNVDIFVPPLISVNPPDRFYFMFQKPITTTPDMANDKDACDALYSQVKGEVAGAIDYLLVRREDDPYRAVLPRLLYEASWGNAGRQAPTFKP